MANYAFIEDGEIKEVVDVLPPSWRNISNFNTLVGQQDILNQLGWVDVVKEDVTINPHTQRLDAPTYSIMQDGRVLQSHAVVDIEQPSTQYIPDANKWFNIRRQRGILMDAMSYKYERYARNERLGLPQVDKLEDMDTYMQQLADITKGDVDAIVWPTYVPSVE